MNEHAMEALVAPMVVAIKETIRHMSELAGEIDNSQKRMQIQNNLNGLLGHINSLNLEDLSTVNPGAILPVFMELMGNLKSSINAVSHPGKRRILLDQLGFLTSQFLNAASAINKAVRPSPVSPRENWGQNRPLPGGGPLKNAAPPRRTGNASGMRHKPM
ncbi:hypothetical protein [Zongyangia hominis]|uniref:Uncharacterized protein n=1 Tax=Zongyangia hominis TaxID=2763677 RepID=A0A926IC50_9FIRM|nr:hypothetical protein [Zongyangia hominis]MBC8570735.1 hypothetical protein [Zongyangia hominis]